MALQTQSGSAESGTSGRLEVGTGTSHWNFVVLMYAEDALWRRSEACILTSLKMRAFQPSMHFNES